MDYVYLGDKNTDSGLRKKFCSAVRKNGKCVRGKNGSMLVVFEDGKERIVAGRLLPKIQNQ
jgi:hypothetical protein